MAAMPKPEFEAAIGAMDRAGLPLFGVTHLSGLVDFLAGQTAALTASRPPIFFACSAILLFAPFLPSALPTVRAATLFGAYWGAVGR
jgi:uncharacterized membrane protein YdjX (TVP38/TMEM64 family)